MNKIIFVSMLIMSMTASAEVIEKELNSRFGEDSGVLVQGTEKDFEIASHLLGIKPPKSWPNKSQNCRTIKCALSKQFTDERSAKLAMEIARRFGIYVSLDQIKRKSDKEKIFSFEEIQFIYEVLNEIPSTFHHMPNFKYFYRNADPLGGSGHVPAIAYPSYSAGYILMADLAFDAPLDLGKAQSEQQWRKITLFHEICHQYDFKGKYSSSNSLNSENQDYGFYQFSWIRLFQKRGDQNRYVKTMNNKYCLVKDIVSDDYICPGEVDYIRPPEKFSTRIFSHRRNAKYNKFKDMPTWYANSNVPEDFAESCAHYRYAPEIFKDIKTLPLLDGKSFGGGKYKNRYEFLKYEVFKGQEYL